MFSELLLNEYLLRALNELGFEQPTPVQEQVIPLALQGRDLLVCAETGSGKTAAFLLPALHRLQARAAPKSGTRALVLVPTRELARQVFKQFKQLASFTGIQGGVITGGDDFKYQRALLRKNPEVIIATPGRLVEHLERKSADFEDLEVLVLDEADRMLDMGFAEDVLKIVERCNRQRQTLLLSATLNHQGIQPVADKVLSDPQSVALSDPREQHSRIQQQVVLADDDRHKEQLLSWLLAHETFNKALIFTNTKTQANRLRGLLAYHNQRAGALHGDMEQVDRNRVMDRLRRGHINVLVATDVAARGLDVKGIDLVINFDLARGGDDYVHRIGRTGRAGESGLAISLVDSSEWNLKSSIERYLKVTFERRTIKELEGKYKGPKKVKTSGRAAGSKKKTVAEKKPKEKSKQRLRDKKNIGKRRSPSGTMDLGDGLAPVKKKIRDD